MAEVLVLAEHTADGEVKKVTLELLTAARRLGEPSVVWTGPGADAAQPRLAEDGAGKGYVADSPDLGGYVVGAAAELLASLVGSASPAAVLIAGTTEGKEIAGRLAVKTGSGGLTDAVDVTPGGGGAARAGRRARRGRRRAAGGPAELRRCDHGALHGEEGHADHRGPAELGGGRALA